MQGSAEKWAQKWRKWAHAQVQRGEEEGQEEERWQEEVNPATPPQFQSCDCLGWNHVQLRVALHYYIYTLW